MITGRENNNRLAAPPKLIAMVESIHKSGVEVGPKLFLVLAVKVNVIKLGADSGIDNLTLEKPSAM